ncbi:MAG: ribonuclease HIII [bacterium]
MNKYYDSQMVPFAEGELLLKAQAIGCEISVDTQYIATFDGENALREAKYWNTRIARRIEKERTSSDLCLRHHIGAAETGSNDYIGPLCVVACYVDEEAIEQIRNFNIEDINELTTQQIITYAKSLKGSIISSLLVLDNSHYNKMISEGTNQANIRARLFNQAIVNVLQKAKKSIEFKVINQFISPKTYFNYLKNEVIVVKDLMFEQDADKQYMAVLAAEIISRYAYLSYTSSMSKSLKTKLPRGSGVNVDHTVAAIAQKYGEKILTKVVKLNFTNTKRVKALLESKDE